MKTCENCSSLNYGDYGSGRFCSSKCARAFSTKDKRKEINKKVSKSLTKNLILKKECKCGKLFKTKKTDRLYCCKSCAGKYTASGWNNHEKVDWSTIHKKAYAEGRNYVGGGTVKWLEVVTSKGIIKVQGSYEVETVKILESWKEKKKILDWQYASDRIEYVGSDNKKHSYLIDFKIFDLDGSFWYLEVKGFVRDNDELKWKAVRKQGFKLEVWFKEDINKWSYGGIG